MTNPYADYEKDGFNQLLKLCKAMCRIVQAWEAVIRAKFGDNEAIINLLDLTLELCALLPAAETAYATENLNSTPPTDVPEDTAGYDPSAPPAEEPDFT
jgi:hypothetical protein